MIFFKKLEKPLIAGHLTAISKVKPMGMSKEDLENVIRAGLPDADVRVEDLRGDGDHYAAYIVSPSFAGKTRIQQHQMVYKALEGRMGGELHALAIQTKAPEQK